MFLLLFALTIPAANWLIGNAGTVCVPQGPCLVPVAPGLMAPSGVMMVGIALVLRDLVQRRLGVGVGLASDPRRRRSLGVPGAASARRRLGGGVPDLGIRRSRGLYAARTARAGRRRGGVGHRRPGRGLVVFLWLAFGSLDFLLGQIVGKAWMVLLSIPFVAWLRRRDQRLGIAPA